MEDFYREIYAVNGVTEIKFPEHYPVSRLIGCVEVVGCLKCEELVCWEAIPESVRLEGLTDFCWLCEQPQKLTVPFEMRGYQGVYNLEKRIYDAALRGLRPVVGPQPVKFPLPDPHNSTSLRPGSLALYPSSSKISAVEKPPSVNAAIAGARAAATQFSKRDQTKSTIENQNDIGQNHDSGGTNDIVFTTENRRLSDSPNSQSHQDDQGLSHVDQQTCPESRGSGRRSNIVGGRGFSPQSGVPSSKLFAAALRGLTLN